MIASDTFYSEQIEIWYISYKSCFINIGLKLGYQKEELSDIINQFFLDLLEKKVRPETINNPQAYLSAAFKRRLIDHYRSSTKNRVIHSENISGNYFEPSIQECLEQLQSNNELIGSIKRAYKKLPNRCQKVIYLKFYKNLTIEEIAEQTHLSKRSVYNNLFEGIKILRGELAEKQPGIHFAALISLFPLAITCIARFYF